MAKMKWPKPQWVHAIGVGFNELELEDCLYETEKDCLETGINECDYIVELTPTRVLKLDLTAETTEVPK